MPEAAEKLDKPTAVGDDGPVVIAEGFPGQRLVVLPRSQVDDALRRPGTSQLVVTDCGYYPEARAHGMHRPDPVAQAVVLVCTSGAGWCRVGGEPHDVGAGQVVVIPPGSPHSYGSSASDPWTLWWLHVDGADLTGLLESTGFTAAAPVRQLADPFRVVDLINEAVSRLEHDVDPRSLLAASGAAWHLLTLLVSADTARRVRNPGVDAARAYLRDNFATRISVQELADRAALSPSHFSALFRQQVGISVLKYHTQLRMTRARELLDTTDLPVAQIAQQVGYDDPFYFTRQFKAVHGLTALHYRRQHKG
jgi:AraC family transcriptional regulator of arabinose operon